MASITTLDAVSRVALLASDVLVDVKPPQPTSAGLSFHYADLQNVAPISTSFISLPNNADPVPILEQNKTATLTSVTLIASSATLQLVPSVPSISDQPIVIHAAYTDLGDLLPLRTSASFFLVSSNSRDAQDNALLASHLATTERKLVIHAFPLEAKEEESWTPIELEKVKPFVTNALQSSNSLNHQNGDIGPSGDKQDGDNMLKVFEEAASSVSSLVGREIKPAVATGAIEPRTLLITVGQASAIKEEAVAGVPGLGHLHISLIQPLSPSFLLQEIPESVNKVVIVEQVYKRATKWTPLFIDVAAALQSREQRPQLFGAVLGQVTSSNAEAAIGQFLSALETQDSGTLLTLGDAPGRASTPTTPQPPHVPRHESSYTKILDQLFGERLEVVNDPNLVPTFGEAATRPEYALGRVRVQDEERQLLEDAVKELIEADSSYNVDGELHAALRKWLTAKDDAKSSNTIAATIVRLLESHPPLHPSVERIFALKHRLQANSRWIIGSDAWSYDLGSSGFHHLISSRHNVNILLLDNTPYTTRNAADPLKRKKDAGLYAMNHGDVYVASIAVYFSYSQALHALMDAEKYNGPSVVLAYLPYTSEDDPALSVLKETKLAVDSGYWPLYKWNPAKEAAGQEPFELESEAVKADLQEFLDRRNHLSQLANVTPEMASNLVDSLGTKLLAERKKKAKQAYDELLSNIGGPPLLILFASDGGKAEKFAKRLSHRASARGLATRLATMDSSSLEELKSESHVAFVTSTAGQGEPPQNGRDFFRALNAAATKGERLFEGTELKFTVFAMGDSHYWPRPEDASYYNKPGKDLDAKLESLGAERAAALGLGDDQDADGPDTGYKVWEPLLWKALGVDAIEVLEKEPEPITNENIKIASNFLRGTIAEGLKDTSTGSLAASDGQLTKFHGIYEQDDRDIRDERKDAGLEPAYSFMIRVRMPGGVCQPDQWLAMDRIADEHGNSTFKLTTRQTFQFHGVIKKHLKPAIQAINKALLDTIAACGDVNRNVLCSSLPNLSHLHTQVYEFSKLLSEHLLPRMAAYYEIWLDKKMVAGDAVKEFEPLYGPYYLPRKFKIAVAVPPNNDVDIFANDVGFIAIADKNGNLEGFNVTAGGGMGVTHSNKKTYPRAADVLGFCTPEQGLIVAEKIMLTQRDNGNRTE
ncbi:hypothetical protein FRC03_010023 [Tulasnella sp. 419]|nr:hypothetical protein FRC03_010023 [Tulasnella sp. 419]